MFCHACTYTHSSAYVNLSGFAVQSKSTDAHAHETCRQPLCMQWQSCKEKLYAMAKL